MNALLSSRMIATTPPSHPPAHTTFSSPPLPSPSQLLGVPTEAKDGARGIPLPTGAIVEFASASNVLRNTGFEDPDFPANKQYLGLADGVDPLRCCEALQPSTTRNKNGNNAPPTFKKPLSTVMDCDDSKKTELNETVDVPAPQIKHPDVMPRKKSRRKSVKSIDEKKGQGKIGKHQITKPRAIKDTTKIKILGPPKKPKEDRGSEQLLTDAIAKKRATVTSDIGAELGGEGAARRRLDWTPVKDTISLVSGASPEATSKKTPDTAVRPEARFGKLLGDYGFSDQGKRDAPFSDAVHISPEGLGANKRRIELVHATPIAASNVVKLKPNRSLKRKLQTITAKATEEFNRKDECYLFHTVFDYTVPLPQNASVQQTKRKPAKTNKSAAKSKKVLMTAPVVLSPGTAMKATSNQNLLFGTSSQLVREESPTAIRDYQEAIKQSLENVSTMQGMNLSSISPQTLSNSLALSPSRNLWSAAACHDEAEFLDLADTPKAEVPTESKPADKNAVDHKASPSNAQDIRYGVVEMSSPIAQPSKGSHSGIEKPDQKLGQSLPRSVAEKALKSRSVSTSTKEKVSCIEHFPDQMPNYQGFSDAELRRVIKSYGFKAIKKREGMISLLEKCWENKQSQVLQELPSNATLGQPMQIPCLGQGSKSADRGETKSCSPAKGRGRPPKPAVVEQAQSKPANAQPKRARGRPKKDLSKTTPPSTKRKPKVLAKDKSEGPTASVGDEIYDSAPPTPSPPRRRKLSMSPNTLTLSPSASNLEVSETMMDAHTTHKANSASHARLLAAITQAVTSQTPTHDPKNPSWHERLLMYEPIILEDLTRWLNVEGLGNVNEDDEVWPTLVKEWCESRSICCLWKENLRGLPRARW